MFGVGWRVERDWRKGEEVSSFPIAAVTSDHTSGAENNTSASSYSSGDRKTKVRLAG